MADHAGLLNQRADIRNAAEHPVRPEDPAQNLHVPDAVQQGDDEGIGTEGGPDRLGGGLAIVGLDREQHAVRSAERGRVVARPHGPELHVIKLAADREAALAHRLEMPAARDEADLVPGRGEARAEVPADAPRAHHGELHDPDLPRSPTGRVPPAAPRAAGYRILIRGVKTGHISMT